MDFKLRWSLTLVVIFGTLQGGVVWSFIDDAETFEKEIRPLLIENCLKCHGVEKQKAGLRVDSRKGLLEGGESAHKEKLKTLKTNVDCLTLTATPIPRTLHFSLMGARDLSIINTPPPNRQPIQTEIQVFNAEFIREAIYFETNRGGQVFFIITEFKGWAKWRH